MSIKYTHRCKRCGEQVVPVTVAGKPRRWANLDARRDRNGRSWDYVCYGGSPIGFSPGPRIAQYIDADEPIVLWHEGVPMDDQEVMDLDLLNGVLNW